MSEARERIPLDRAREIAADLETLIGPYCERFLVAGSIRRRKETVGDIEILVMPKRVPVPIDLFGATKDLIPLDDLCDRLRADGVFQDRLDVNGRPAWGQRYKRLRYRDVPVDLFSVLPPSEWGVQSLIRTGPAAYSHKFVTQRYKGGYLPDHLYVRDGAIQRFGGEVTPTPEETDVYDLIGLPYQAPEERR